MAYGQEWSVYAVGSQAHVSFLDPRQPSHNVKSVCSKERGSGKKLVKGCFELFACRSTNLRLQYDMYLLGFCFFLNN